MLLVVTDGSELTWFILSCEFYFEPHAVSHVSPRPACSRKATLFWKMRQHTKLMNAWARESQTYWALSMPRRLTKLALLLWNAIRWSILMALVVFWFSGSSRYLEMIWRYLRSLAPCKLRTQWNLLLTTAPTAILRSPKPLEPWCVLEQLWWTSTF